MNPWLILFIECVILCSLFFLMCFLGTGNGKNIASLSSYPKQLQEMIRNDERYKDSVRKPANVWFSLLSNLILFIAVDFIFGLFLRSKDYVMNFVYLLILGQTLNLFDLLVIDMLWWRNSKRIRFEGYEDKNLYKDIKLHIYSMLRAIPVFTLAAAIAGAFLILF